MGFDKFIEKMTVINTAVFTVCMIILGGTIMNALYILVSVPIFGLLVLAIHEGRSGEYRCLKDAMKERNRIPYFDWKQMLKEVRRGYIASIFLAIVWNIALYVIGVIYLLMKLGL